MAFPRNERTVILTVGRVTHTIKADTLLRIPAQASLSQWIQQSRKTSGYCQLEQRDGHAFAYIWHYLATGDLVYPLHEGFQRVDVVLQELSSCGLADDVMRMAQEESKKKRRETTSSAIVITDNSPSKHLQSEHRQRRMSDTNAVNIQRSWADLSSDHDYASRPATCQKNVSNTNGGKRHSYSASTADLGYHLQDKVSQTEGRALPFGHTLAPSSSESRISSLKSELPERFLSLLKRYLNLKSSSNGPAKVKSLVLTNNHANHNTSFVATPATRSLGVFRPATSHGATLILLVTAEDLTVFGHRLDLELTFPDVPLLPLRTTSVLINCQIFIENPANKDNKKYNTTSEWALAIYHKQVSKAGFHLTVNSEWREHGSTQKLQQWICHKSTKKGYNRNSKSTVRKKSVLTKFFHKDES